MQHRITHRARMTRAALRSGTAELPAGITYLWIPAAPPVLAEFEAGEFPHAPMFAADDAACPAALLLTIAPGFEHEPWCTRADDGHELHVAHLVPGRPIAAWTDGAR